MQVVERVRRKAAIYGQDITSSSSAPGLDNGSSDEADSARCDRFLLHSKLACLREALELCLLPHHGVQEYKGCAAVYSAMSTLHTMNMQFVASVGNRTTHRRDQTPFL